MKTIKKLSFILFVSLCTVQMSQAQQLFAGGSLSFNSQSSEVTSGGTTSEGPTTNTIGFNPRAGYYMSDGLVIGAGLGVNTSTTTTPGNPETVNKSRTISVNPFARYYLLNKGDFAVFGEGGFRFGFGSQETTVGNTTNDGPTTNSFSIYVTPMFEYSISDMVSLEASVGNVSFNTSTQETTAGNTTTENKSSNFNFSIFPNSINFGVKVLF